MPDTLMSDVFVSRSSRYEQSDIVEPEFHAGKIHALLAALVCIDDTPQQFEPEDKDDIRTWLVHMARNESYALQKALEIESSEAARQSTKQST